MTTKAILTTLWPAIRRILGKLGRWVLDVIGRRGVDATASYLEVRVGLFERRRRRARSDLRQRWLTGRIRRWTAAARWLRSEEASRMRGEVIDLAVERARRELPERAPEESFDRWRRTA